MKIIFCIIVNSIFTQSINLKKDSIYDKNQKYMKEIYNFKTKLIYGDPPFQYIIKPRDINYEVPDIVLKKNVLKDTVNWLAASYMVSFAGDPFYKEELEYYQRFMNKKPKLAAKVIKIFLEHDWAGGLNHEKWGIFEEKPEAVIIKYVKLIANSYGKFSHFTYWAEHLLKINGPHYLAIKLKFENAKTFYEEALRVSVLNNYKISFDLQKSKKVLINLYKKETNQLTKIDIEEGRLLVTENEFNKVLNKFLKKLKDNIKLEIQDIPSIIDSSW